MKCEQSGHSEFKFETLTGMAEQFTQLVDPTDECIFSKVWYSKTQNIPCSSLFKLKI